MSDSDPVTSPSPPSTQNAPLDQVHQVGQSDHLMADTTAINPDASVELPFFVDTQPNNSESKAFLNDSGEQESGEVREIASATLQIQSNTIQPQSKVPLLFSPGSVTKGKEGAGDIHKDYLNASTNQDSVSAQLSNSNSLDSKPGRDFPSYSQFHPTNTVQFETSPEKLATMPEDCRLFVGNLASERVSKEDLATQFAKYGSIYEILIKSSYGFIQFDKSEACRQAILNENGKVIGSLKMDLKVSKNKDHRVVKYKEMLASGASMDEIRDYASKVAGRQSAVGGPRNARGRSAAPEGPQRFGPTDRYERFDNRRDRGKPYERPLSKPHGQGQPYPDEYPPEALPRRRTHDIPQIQLIGIGEISREFLHRVEDILKQKGYVVSVLYPVPKIPFRSALQHWAREGVQFVLCLKSHYEPQEVLDVIMCTDFEGNTRDFNRVPLDAALAIVDSNRDARGPKAPPAYASVNSRQNYGPNPNLIPPPVLHQLAPHLPLLVQLGSVLQQQTGQPLPASFPSNIDVNAIVALLGAINPASHTPVPHTPAHQYQQAPSSNYYPNYGRLPPGPHMTPSMPAPPLPPPSGTSVQDLLAKLAPRAPMPPAMQPPTSGAQLQNLLSSYANQNR